MKYNFVFNETGRAVVAAIADCPQPEGLLLEVPEDFDFSRAEDWTYADGAWTYDPLPPAAPEPEPEPGPSEAERIAELEEALELLLSGVTE